MLSPEQSADIRAKTYANALSKNARKALLATSFPTKKTPDYGHNRFSQVLPKQLKLAAPAPLDPKPLKQLERFNAPLMVINNGELEDSPGNAPLLNNFENLNDPFEIINRGFPHKKRFRLTFSGENSLIILAHINTLEPKDLWSLPEILVHVEAQSTLSLLECHLGTGGAKRFSSTLTEFQVEENAKVHYTKVILGGEALHFSKVRASLSRDALFHSFIFSKGGGLTRNHVEINLDKSGANAYANGLFYLQEKEYSDYYSCINHISPQTESSQLFKGVAKDRSTGTFTGKIKVEKNAPGVCAHQLNKNLLLGHQSKIKGQPVLEIDTDDVQCTHGATIGHLCEDELFYLQTRGIPLNQAKKLLTMAFVSESINFIPNRNIRKWLTDLLDLKE